MQSQQSSLPGCEGVGGDPVCESKGSEEDSQLEKTPLSPYQPDQTVGKSITHLLVLLYALGHCIIITTRASFKACQNKSTFAVKTIIV